MKTGRLAKLLGAVAAPALLGAALLYAVTALSGMKPNLARINELEWDLVQRFLSFLLSQLYTALGCIAIASVIWFFTHKALRLLRSTFHPGDISPFRVPPLGAAFVFESTFILIATLSYYVGFLGRQSTRTYLWLAFSSRGPSLHDSDSALVRGWKCVVFVLQWPIAHQNIVRVGFAGRHVMR